MLLDLEVECMNKIFSSNRWLSFLESTANGLQINLSFLLSEFERIEASDICPLCHNHYLPLTNNDNLEAYKLAPDGLTEFVTENGDSAISLIIDGGIPLIIRGCPCCKEAGKFSLMDRAQIAQKLLNSFYIALSEGFEGGSRAIENSTLRHMNHIILSLFQGKEDAAERSFDLILSALIIILDAQGSWLELNDPLNSQVIYKGDQQVINNYLDIGIESTGVSVDIVNNGIKGRIGVFAPADIKQANQLLPLMAQEAAIVIEIDNLFKLFHKRLIRILEAIDSAIVVVDKKGILSYANSPFQQLTGIPNIEIIGKQFDFITGPWTPYIKSAISERIEGKVDILRLNNQQVCIDWQVCPLIEDEIVQGWIIFIKDRTDYYRWQEEIKKAERLGITSSLVGSLAHELRNPMSAAKALLQIAQKKGDVRGAEGYFDLVNKEIDRMTRLLNEFLLLGKPAEKHDEPLQLALLIEELLPLLEAEACNYGSELQINIKYNSLIKADPGQITQVLMNLICNAAQAAGESGRIVLSLHEIEETAVLTIKDSGPGIDPKIRDSLFMPFFTRKERGTGLGLPVVQAIVHNHGGDILVENAKEGGAVFKVILPSYKNSINKGVDVLIIVKDI